MVQIHLIKYIKDDYPKPWQCIYRSGYMQYKNKNLAKMMAVIPQNILIDYDFTVLSCDDGKSPYKRSFQDFDSEDDKHRGKVYEATNTWI